MRQRPRQTLQLGPADEAMLRSLYRYSHLTVRQVARRLSYARGSIESLVQPKLKSLSEAGFVHRLVLPRKSQNGRAPYVYTLDSLGRRYLSRLGEDVSGRYRPSEEAEHSYLFLAHRGLVADLLITLDLFAEEFPDRYAVQELISERALKRRPISVELSRANSNDDNGSDPRRVSVIPDAWIRFSDLANGYELPLALELDNNTEEKRQFTQKAAALILYPKSPEYRAQFQTDALTVLVLVASGGAPRLLHLLRWTEDALTRAQATNDADLFRFADFSNSQLSPSQLFGSPRWFTPFRTRKGVDGVAESLIDYEPTVLFETSDNHEES